MKNKPPRLPELSQPSDEDIRLYAYQIYEQNNRLPGHDLAHWFEAAAFLRSNSPFPRAERKEHSGVS